MSESNKPCRTLADEVRGERTVMCRVDKNVMGGVRACETAEKRTVMYHANKNAMRGERAH